MLKLFRWHNVIFVISVLIGIVIGMSICHKIENNLVRYEYDKGVTNEIHV